MQTIGGIIYFSLDVDVDTGSPSTTDDSDDFQPFTDSFRYTITNACGKTASAFVQVKAPAATSWKYALLPDYKTAAQVGVDGKAGYNLFFSQKFGPPKGTTLPEQTWQQNLHSHKYFYMDKQQKKLVAEQTTNLVMADTVDIGRRQTIISYDDNLGMDTKPNQVPLYIYQFVDKTLGFNAVNTKLPVPATQPWFPNPAEAAVLATMQGPKGNIATLYLFVDKTRIENYHKATKPPFISDAEYDKIVSEINGIGLNYATLPPVYESFQLGALGNWKFPAKKP